jgi:hypothetical protein
LVSEAVWSIALPFKKPFITGELPLCFGLDMYNLDNMQTTAI